jgi:hypothetical protein
MSGVPSRRVGLWKLFSARRLPEAMLTMKTVRKKIAEKVLEETGDVPGWVVFAIHL